MWLDVTPNHYKFPPIYTAKILLPYGNGYADKCLIDLHPECIYNTSHSNVSKEIILNGTYTFCNWKYQSVTVSAYFLKYYANVMCYSLCRSVKMD